MKRTLIIFMLLFCGALIEVMAQGGSRDIGSVRGVIRNAKTGEPIAYATVSVYNTKVARMADSLGRFLVDEVPVGYQRFLFQSVGYEDMLSEPVQITVSRVRELNAEMIPRNVELGSVTIVGRNLRRIETPPLSTFRLNVQDIEKSPGGNRDISKVVQNIPGVAATPSYRNDLIVRGGSPSENKFYLDRIEIPIINHFAQQGASGGNASLINSDFLSGATLYTSAFPVSAAGSLSSVLDMRMIEGNSDRFKAKFSIGASDFALTLDSPLGKKASVIASYRVSYLQLLFKLIRLPFLPTYNDAQIKFSYHITERDNLYVIGLWGYDINRLNLGLRESPDLTASQRYILDYVPENDQWSYVAGLVYTHNTDRGQITAVLSRDHVNNSLQKWQNNDPAMGKNLDYISNEAQWKTRLEYAADFGRGFSFITGAGLTYGAYDNRTFQKLLINGQPFENRYSSDLNLVAYSAFASVGKSFADGKVRLTLSGRVEGNNYSSQMSNPLTQFSPRLALNYKFVPRWEFNMSIGRYFQQPLYTSMGFRNEQNELVNRNTLKYTGSDQISAGFAFSPSSVSRISVEGFYKDYSAYPMSLRDSIPVGGGRPFDVFVVGAEAVRSVGRGRAYGVELLFRHSDLWGFRINASYTYYRSEFRKLDHNFEPNGPYVPSSWDNQHLFTLVVSRELGRGWEIGLRWRFAGGAPYTPYDVAASMKKEQWDASHRPVLNYALENTGRLPAFHQADLRVDKTWFFRHWTLGIYVDIQNLYNYASLGQELLLPQIDPTTGKYVVNEFGNYIPVLHPGTLGGTIIPTLGVVIEF